MNDHIFSVALLLDPPTYSAAACSPCREEVEAGETQLFLESGRPLREVSVLNVLLSNGRGQVLYEAAQVRAAAGCCCTCRPGQAARPI